MRGRGRRYRIPPEGYHNNGEVIIDDETHVVYVLILVTVFLRRWAVFIFLPIIILYGWAAWYNVWGHELYYPRLLELLRYLAI